MISFNFDLWKLFNTSVKFTFLWFSCNRPWKSCYIPCGEWTTFDTTLVPAFLWEYLFCGWCKFENLFSFWRRSEKFKFHSPRVILTRNHNFKMPVNLFESTVLLRINALPRDCKRIPRINAPFSHSFKSCGLNLKNNGSKDGLIHCFKEGEPCQNGKEQLISQLDVLDEPDRPNPFDLITGSRRLWSRKCSFSDRRRRRNHWRWYIEV